MTTTRAAVPPGADLGALGRLIAQARENFLTAGVASTALRPLVAASWRRSLDQGVDPGDSRPPLDLEGGDLEAYRRAHPLAVVMPVVRRLLVDHAAEAGLIVAVSDDQGRLLWVEGARGLRRRAEAMLFVEGARWSEDAAGTNAPGTALALDQPVQIFAAEHLAQPVTPWSCTACPVHGPDGRVLGAIDITGGAEVASVQTLLLVRATVAAAEAELRAMQPQPVERLVRPALRRPTTGPGGAAVRGSASSGPAAAASTRLQVLGAQGRSLRGPGAEVALRMRHAEILLLLVANPQGLSGEQLAILLNDQRTAAVTLRADLSRLRAVLAETGAPALSASPYRLAAEVGSDYDEVRRLLRRGAVRRALAGYPGPLLPESVAPGVEDLRDQLALEVRACVLACADGDLLWAFAHRPEGVEDVEVWRACRRLLPRNSRRIPIVEETIRRLDAQFGC